MEYIGVKTNEETYGVCGLSKNVFESIANHSLDDYKKAKVLSNPTGSNKVGCKLGKEGITINLDVRIKMGYNVTQVCHEIQNTVSKNIKNMTGIQNVAVNIDIKGFYI